jgi:hypothetical protein
VGFLFEPYHRGRCCLCGSRDALTGEHKIKASALRSIFGRDEMVIGRFDSIQAFRSAQGPKSRAFHFEARMCASCNEARTQGSDLEFDRFHQEVMSQIAKGNAPASVFDLPRYAKDSDPYLNIFRYFAKLLCCHVAESGGPRTLALSEFAIAKVDHNPVLLHIDADPNFVDYSTIVGDLKYAAHGGLIVPFNAKINVPTSFRSSLTLGPVRYIFFVRYSPIVGMAIRLFHRDFWRKCEAAYQEALQNPLNDTQMRRLGL